MRQHWTAPCVVGDFGGTLSEVRASEEGKHCDSDDGLAPL